jgi:predicted ATPase/class 3 adenylate cyclase
VSQGRQSASVLPTGTVTFLFTDIEGSTRLVQQLGPAYPAALSTHRDLVITAADANGGQTFGSEGDALFIAFPDAPSAVAAAAGAQRSLGAHAWPQDQQVRVRMGIHTGDVALSGGDYVGLPLHQVARITAAGHGGQVLLSEATRALAETALPAGVTLRDLGQYRLKDLTRPERLFELVIDGLEGSFPPLRTIDVRPNNLPVQLTTFVGRDELERARRLLETTRLLTLTGPGGIGKTRLALQLAAETVDAFPDGLFFVPLDAVFDPDLIPSAIAEALQVEAGGEPPLTRVIEYLRGRRTLLVLDNFEQIVDGAGIVARLLTEAPRLTVMVTSRVLLRTYGEQEFPVPPLRLPEPGGVSGAGEAAGIEAVRLFVERAMASQPSFTLTDANAPAVADIVTRLDGLPLAIELAAARVRVLPVESLRARLDDRLGILTGGARDRPERQQTLRGAIAWSHDLLDEPDRRLFARFSAFAGGACLQQAEEVCGPGSELGREVLAGLSSLVEKSLIRPDPASDGEPRFAMLATIREYATERLEESGAAEALRRRHAGAYLALVESCAAELTGPMGRRWLDRLELDHDNLRAAFDWTMRAGEPELALRMVAGAWRFWQIRGHLHEAQERAARALALPGAATLSAAIRARALGAAGSIAYWRGNIPEVHRLYREALGEARRSGDLATIAEALYNVAFAPSPDVLASERFLLGAEYVTEALALYRQLGDERGIANTTWALGLGAMANRDWGGSRAYIGESLRAYRALDDPFGMGWALFELATIETEDGTPDEAEPYVLEALKVFAAAGDLSAEVLVLASLIVIAQQRGQVERAWRLAGAASALRRRTGTDLVLVSGWRDRQLPERPVDDPDAERAWAEGEAMSAEAVIAYALGDDSG